MGNVASRVCAALLSVVLVACDGNSTVPAAPPTDGPSARTAISSAYEISDVRLVTQRDPVVFWQVSFDARWSGAGAPSETRCRWRMLGADGVAIISGGIELQDKQLDDEIAASVYPDEIPGVPKAAVVDCKTP